MSRIPKLSLALTAVTGLCLGLASPAAAQSLTGSALEEAVVSSNADPTSSGNAINSTLSLLESFGSSEVPVSSVPGSSFGGINLPLDERITETKLLNKQVENAELRQERWTIASWSMKRNVEVQIVRAADPTANTPMLYLLDGVGAPRDNWWLGTGDAHTQFGDENIHLILPTQAQASMYADWQRNDPSLGRHQWETFITRELAPLVKRELGTTGNSGIGGLSMGATGAVHIANKHPDLFKAVFGLSGCYSPMDPIGRQNAHLTVTTRGGNLDNLYGPYGSERWIYHDTVGNPEGLRNQRVYLSAATGAFAPEDVANYANNNWFDMSSGAALERSSLECTRLLDDAMTERGYTGHKVDYAETGTHDWHTFREQLPAAWAHIKPALL
ncbi:alpha/beta hydrolase [Corynebacterium comes]|uniref:Diacylglycerol acyltransferase/mycolyltransferase Ag85A n=1 Tax=Corynebacterium comes TaxID=2675218 RepID=A0A6B8W5P7_9CORY|nr:alpha/beta hydrolase family protein [Corynebacterium comes]QGU05250.1 Diacylglycerol acyltransferase/mycolyltransferase Ag85A precursor [Corynebacterium comes]